jgi:6-phosphofructokinase 1
MAMDLVKEGVSNRLVALRNGTYTSIPITTISTGEKRVDVEELYDSDNYRPRVRRVEGKPMFLY